jgi:Tfp pilus assembly protein PilN
MDQLISTVQSLQSTTASVVERLTALEHAHASLATRVNVLAEQLTVVVDFAPIVMRAKVYLDKYAPAHEDTSAKPGTSAANPTQAGAPVT